MARVWIEKKLNELNKRKGDLAVALSIPPSRVSDILRGKRRIHSQEIVKLSHFLKMDINTVLDLLEDNKNETYNSNPDKTEQIQVVGNLKISESSYAVWPAEKRYTITLPKQASYTSTQKFALEKRSPSRSLLTLLICIPSTGWPTSNTPFLQQIEQKIEVEVAYGYEHTSENTEEFPITAMVIAAYQQH